MTNDAQGAATKPSRRCERTDGARRSCRRGPAALAGGGLHGGGCSGRGGAVVVEEANKTKKVGNMRYWPENAMADWPKGADFRDSSSITHVP